LFCAAWAALLLGAFNSVEGVFCSKKEQKPGVRRKYPSGATYSLETGCTFFELLNSIRAQGATSLRDRFIGWWLSWGNISHKCAEYPTVSQT
jgi:hypothetical protein